MFETEDHVDVMADPQYLFQTVGDLMSRGHYMPDGVIGLRQLAERPISPTEKFLPGQRVAFVFEGESREHEITDVEEWDKAEARLIEKRLRSPKGETYKWRLSELTMGTYRVTLTFSADYGILEKMSKGNAAKAFISMTLKRLKPFVEDKVSHAGPRTFVSRAVPIIDPLS